MRPAKFAVMYVLLPAAALAGAAVAYFELRQPAMAPAASIRVQSTPERLARGKYLFENLADCAGCHSPRIIERYTAPVDPARVGAGFVFPPELGLPGRVVGANLTPDPETGLGRWNDGEKLRAIREGVSRDGRALFPFMPYHQFARMSDEDAFSLVAYMNSLPSVRNPLPPTELRFPLPWLIKGEPRPLAGPVMAPAKEDTIRYGEYLVALAGCASCHTPHDSGTPIDGMEFAGGEEFRAGPYVARSANITPDEDSGIGGWTAQRFISKFQGYRNFTLDNLPKTNQSNFTLMPWTAYAHLSDHDLLAIYRYLRTVRPRYNPVVLHPQLPNS